MTDKQSGQPGDQERPDASRGGMGEASGKVEAFVAKLAKEEMMLVLLQSELYDGDWQAMLDDLRNRLDGKPYIFKLANRIRDDIARIEKLEAFESEHAIRLANYVKPPDQQQQ